MGLLTEKCDAVDDLDVPEIPDVLDVLDVPSVTGQYVSWGRMLVNIIGCLLALPLYWTMTVHCKYPVTLDMIVTIALAELNRLVNENRRSKFYEEENRIRGKIDCEKVDLELQPAVPRLDSMAAVVGWREDPSVFRRAMESYQSARTCRFLVVGVDGDEALDQDMVDVFNEVYPDGSRVIHVPEPLGEVAEKAVAKMIDMQQQCGQEVDHAACHDAALQHCIRLARVILEQEGVGANSIGSVRQLCLRQRHMHKKGIMFTTFVFCVVIAEMLGIEFLWSSDSDTLVMPDSIEGTVNAIAADPTIGGASSGLVIHNELESPIASLAATVYWGELYLTRSTPAATATSDCQSGPSTVFRLTSLPSILVPWYLQTIMGKRMIINEDRHLTSNLLSRGWGVVFASDVLTATDTPITLTQWLKQQVRWARATHIESLLQPKVYLMSHPLLFYGMAKREFGPVISAVAILYYLFTAEDILAISVWDLVIRTLVSLAYNTLRNPHRLTRRTRRWVLPGMLFYYIPLPAVHCWSMMTLTADGWGTTMRAGSERARRNTRRQAWWEVGFFIVWMGVVAAACTKWLATHYGLDWTLIATAKLCSAVLASYCAWRATIAKL